MNKSSLLFNMGGSLAIETVGFGLGLGLGSGLTNFWTTTPQVLQFTARG